jgi:hypothetical protein
MSELETIIQTLVEDLNDKSMYDNTAEVIRIVEGALDALRELKE